MKIAIGFSGPAGKGINTAGIMLAELLVNKGYNIIGDKEYESIIKGGNNNFFIYVSDNKPSVDKKIDHFFAFDSLAATKNKEIYNIENLYEIKSVGCKYHNTFSFGASLKVLGIDLEEGKKIFNNKFEGDILESNIADLEVGYDYINKSSFDLSKTIGDSQKLYFGNQIIAQGAINSGLEFYSGYPMTPASSIIDEVTKDKNVIFFQGEDEIAVSMAMLGANFTGKRAMCGTSGGGFALMSESLSFANQTEIGGVYILSQRAGPSTGTPTYHEQADLNYALNATFGDTTPIVVAPSDYINGYNLIGKALNWADIYQYPVIVLLDKQYSESYMNINPKKLTAEEINRGKINLEPVTGFARYSNTKDGISPRTIPGTKDGEFIATSYEHNQYGATDESSENKIEMTEKRFKKIDTFISNEFSENYYGYEIINPEANRFYITFGFNKITLESNLKDNEGIITIKNIQPLDLRLAKFFEENKGQIEELVFVESNYSGQLEELITNKCNLNTKERKDKIKNIRKYDLYPLFSEDLS